MKNKINKAAGGVVAFGAIFGFALTASAHVIVTPDTAGVASFQNFTVSVPTEKNIPTTAVKLLLPPGLVEVYPDATPGWTISIKCQGETQANLNAADCDNDGAAVTEIDWTAGQIPVGEREQFIFSAQVPATPTTLIWKAYQTYADGSVVSWDQGPTTDETDTAGPYSQTMVINDIGPGAGNMTGGSSTTVDWALGLAILGVILSGYCFIAIWKKN